MLETSRLYSAEPAAAASPLLYVRAQATATLKATSIPGPKPYYITDESPDVWFEPTEVWEIRGAALTISPVHKAAVGPVHPDRGISLRLVFLAPIVLLYAQQVATSCAAHGQQYELQQVQLEWLQCCQL